MVGPAFYDFLSLKRADHFAYCCLRACVCVRVYMSVRACVCECVCGCVYVWYSIFYFWYHRVGVGNKCTLQIETLP